MLMSVNFGGGVPEDISTEQGASAGSLFAPGRQDGEFEQVDDEEADSEGVEDPNAEVEFVTSGSSEDADYEEEPEQNPEEFEAQLVLCMEVMTETLHQLEALKLSARQRHERYDE